MTRILILLFLLMCYGLHSQDGSKPFRLGINLSSDYNLSSKNIDFENYTGYTSSYDSFNYSLGVQAEKFFVTNISINLGLQFAHKNFTGDYYCAVCNWPRLPTPEKIKMQYLEIPIGIRKYFLPGKWKLFADIGLVNQFTLENDLENNKYLISGKLGGGTEYKINNNTALQLTAIYNRALSRTFEGSDHKMEFLSVGVGILTGL